MKHVENRFVWIFFLGSILVLVSTFSFSSVYAIQNENPPPLVLAVAMVDPADSDGLVVVEENGGFCTRIEEETNEANSGLLCMSIFSLGAGEVAAKWSAMSLAGKIAAAVGGVATWKVVLIGTAIGGSVYLVAAHWDDLKSISCSAASTISGLLAQFIAPLDERARQRLMKLPGPTLSPNLLPLAWGSADLNSSMPGGKTVFCPGLILMDPGYVAIRSEFMTAADAPSFPLGPDVIPDDESRVDRDVADDEPVGEHGETAGEEGTDHAPGGDDITVEDLEAGVDVRGVLENMPGIEEIDKELASEALENLPQEHLNDTVVEVLTEAGVDPKVAEQIAQALKKAHEFARDLTEQERFLEEVFAKTPRHPETEEIVISDLLKDGGLDAGNVEDLCQAWKEHGSLEQMAKDLAEKGVNPDTAKKVLDGLEILTKGD